MESNLTERLVRDFDSMPRQIRRAAQWLIDHPTEGALLSMREQARRARVVPATMTRLARRLGFRHWDELREIYANDVRHKALGLGLKADALKKRRDAKGTRALGAELVVSMAEDVMALAEPAALAGLTGAVQVLARAERTFCLGQRSSFPIAYHFHYIRSLFGAAVVLIDGAGGIGSDALRDAGRGDALLAVSVQPYTRATVECADVAARRGVRVVAITDSRVSPLARLARATVIVPTSTPSFFHSMTAGFAAVEALCALLAVEMGEDAIAALDRSERHLEDLGAFVLPRRRRRPARAGASGTKRRRAATL